MELVLKEFIRAEGFERRALVDTDCRTGVLAPSRAMAIECAGRCGGGVCLDNAVVNSQVWLAFVLIDRILNRYDDPHGR
jgi:hypothetical protein